jgi:hypothetical protein
MRKTLAKIEQAVKELLKGTAYISVKELDEGVGCDEDWDGYRPPQTRYTGWTTWQERLFDINVDHRVAGKPKILFFMPWEGSGLCYNCYDFGFDRDQEDTSTILEYMFKNCELTNEPYGPWNIDLEDTITCKECNETCGFGYKFFDNLMVIKHAKTNN